MPKKHILFIPRKADPTAPTHDSYMVDMQAIEKWANSLPVSLYASLTGPGETASPGQLTQAGDFVVNANGAVGINLTSAGPGGIFLTNNSGAQALELTTGAGFSFVDAGGPGNETFFQENSDGGFFFEDLGGGGFAVNTTGHINLQTLPTTNPGGTGNLWNSGGVVHIT